MRASLCAALSRRSVISSYLETHGRAAAASIELTCVAEKYKWSLLETIKLQIVALAACAAQGSAQSPHIDPCSPRHGRFLGPSLGGSVTVRTKQADATCCFRYCWGDLDLRQCLSTAGIGLLCALSAGFAMWCSCCYTALSGGLSHASTTRSTMSSCHNRHRHRHRMAIACSVAPQHSSSSQASQQIGAARAIKPESASLHGRQDGKPRIEYNRDSQQTRHYS